MSASGKPDLGRSWSAAEVILDDEGDRIAKLSDEDFEREMASLPDPAHVPSVETLLTRPRPRSIVTLRPARPKPRTRLVWLIAAALSMLAIVYALQPDETVGSAKNGPRAMQQDAQRLRRGATDACDHALWGLCEERLDEARRLDPKGDDDPLVQKTRKAAYDGLHPDPNRDEKPRGP